MILDKDGKTTRAPFRVAVSIPSGDQVAAGFSYDLARMMTATASQRKDIELRLHMTRDSILPRARHDLVVMALETDCTHILFLDSDMRFPKDALVRLLAHSEPIVGVNYARRRFPPTPVASDELGQPLYVEDGVEGLEHVSHTGMGVMLVDLDVFRQIPAPWFQIGFRQSTSEYVGEDVIFMTLVREHGLTVLVDNTLSREVSHLGEMEYRSEHTLQMRELAVTNEVAVRDTADVQ